MKHQPTFRRNFLKIGLTALFTPLLAKLPASATGKASQDHDKGVVIHEHEGIFVMTRRKVPIAIKISKAQHGIGNISFCREQMTPGWKMRIHKHLNNDELIFIHRGHGILTLGDQRVEVETGAVAFIPRGTWHGLENTGSEDLQMIFQYTPAGFEEFFIENGTRAGMPAKERTQEEYALTAEKYGMVYK